MKKMLRQTRPLRRLLLTACMVLCSTAMFAEQGEVWLGVQANYGFSKNIKNFGAGAKVQYEPIRNLRGEGSFNYFFKHDYFTLWDANFNVHYLVQAGPVTIYPLVGVGLLSQKSDDTYFDMHVPQSDKVLTINMGGFDERQVALNVGGGVEYKLTPSIKINLEGKYQTEKNYDRGVVSLGISFGL